MTVDHLRPGEALPEGGLTMPNPDPNWIWVARDENNTIMAYVVCLYGHGLIIPIRLHRLESAPITWAAILLRKAARECADRGFTMYMLWLGDDTKEQLMMKKMCLNRGAVEFAMAGSVLAGSTSSFARVK